MEARINDATRTMEDRFTKTVPSSGFLGIAVGAMALSLMFKATGKGKWGNFVANWVPTLLIVGLSNKLVRLNGHNSTNRTSDVPRLETIRYAEKFPVGD
jgi:hypothetical protein